MTTAPSLFEALRLDASINDLHIYQLHAAACERTGRALFLKPAR
jgi:hypothetical protein